MHSIISKLNIGTETNSLAVSFFHGQQNRGKSKAGRGIIFVTISVP